MSATHSLDIKSRIVGLVHLRSEEIIDHPLQHREHSDEQVAVLRDLVQTIGQADVLVVYRSPQLEGAWVAIDGHGRKNQTGVVSWDCLHLDVTDQEADVLLATLDMTSAMATINKDRFETLYDALPVQNEATQLALDETLGARMPRKDLAFGGIGAPEDASGASEGDKSGGGAQPTEGLRMGVPLSAVRMVQLYLDGTTHPELMDMVDGLSQKLDTHNITETVMAAVRYAHQRVVIDGDAPLNTAAFAGAAAPQSIEEVAPTSAETEWTTADYACLDCGQEYTAEKAAVYEYTCIECTGTLTPVVNAEPSA